MTRATTPAMDCAYTVAGQVSATEPVARGRIGRGVVRGNGDANGPLSLLMSREAPYKAQAIAPADIVEQWAATFPGECVVASGQRILGHDKNPKLAWRQAKSIMTKEHIDLHDVIQVFF